MSDTEEYMPWSEELSVGLEEIDEQHKVLVTLINRLFSEAILKKSEPGIVASILGELAQYTIVHFAVEESLFRIFDYPDSQNHVQHHRQLRDEVLKIQVKFNEGHAVDLELMRFLRHWLRHHIMGDDKKFTPFFLDKGFKLTGVKNRSWVGKIWDSIHL